MDAIKCIKSASAVRCYAKTPVAREVVLEVLKAGRASGSGKNMQAWHFVLVTDRDLLLALSSTGRYAGHLGEAAFGVVITSKPNPHVPGIAWFDGGRAAQNMMLAGTQLGLGSCPVGFRDDPKKATRLLSLPDESEIIIGIAFGYPDTSRRQEEREFRRSVLDLQGRKPLEHLVSENIFGVPLGEG